jgi:hypothetical protein
VFVRNLKSSLLIAALCFGNFAHAESVASLFGSAAIAAAISPAVVGGIQADADRYLGGLDASTQMYLNDSNNRTSLALGYVSSGTALSLANMQMQTALYANQQVTQRQQLQLDAVGRTNSLNYAMQMQQMQTDYQLKFASLALQSKTIDMNYRAALANSGTQPTFQLRSDGDAMSVHSYGLAAPSASVTSATPLLVTTPVSSTAMQSAASSRLLSSVQTRPVLTTPTAMQSNRAVVPSRALLSAAQQPIQSRGIASVRTQAPEWVRHQTSLDAQAPASQEPVLSGGHKPQGL